MMKLLVRLLNWLWRVPPAFVKSAIAPLPQAQSRGQRSTARKAWRVFRRSKQRIGPPILTGARLERIQEQCARKLSRRVQSES